MEAELGRVAVRERPPSFVDRSLAGTSRHDASVDDGEVLEVGHVRDEAPSGKTLNDSTRDPFGTSIAVVAAPSGPSRTTPWRPA